MFGEVSLEAYNKNARGHQGTAVSCGEIYLKGLIDKNRLLGAS